MGGAAILEREGGGGALVASLERSPFVPQQQQGSTGVHILLYPSGTVCASSDNTRPLPPLRRGLHAIQNGSTTCGKTQVIVLAGTRTRTNALLYRPKQAQE